MRKKTHQNSSYFRMLFFIFMKKVFILCFMIVFLSSCMKLDYDLNVSEDLIMDWKITMDLTKFNAITESMQSSFWTGAIKKTEKKEPCDTYNSKDSNTNSSIVFKDVTCKNIDENIAEISWKWLSLKDIVHKVDNGYKIYLNDLSDQSKSQTWTNDFSDDKQVAFLKSAWFELNFKLHFASEIVESNVWTIVWKTLNYSLYDTIWVDKPYVIIKTISDNVTLNTILNLLNS